MYVVVNKVKKKIKAMGFRAEPAVIQALDVAVCTILEGARQWTKPKKTMTRDDILNYLAHHKLKI